jgi:glycosyltransferase involved in cell wall biosynthesis
LAQIVRDGCEGVLYDSAASGALADALTGMLDVDRRKALGRAARARVAEHFSWSAHCERLEREMEARLRARRV